MATDKQLIEQIQKGKSEAYGQLFRKYYQQIYSICFSILKNSHDAEEVTQETFIQAYLKLDQLKKPDKFFAWLKKIARNHSKRYAQSKETEIVPLDLASAQTATQIAPEEGLLRQELIDSILEAIEALPPKDREVVRAHIDGLNHAEISERFGISIEASMSRLYRARKKLAAHVKDLLSAIFGLPKMLPFKKIISGGIMAMKIGTSTKVTVGVIGVLVAGFIGFQVVTHQPDVKSPKVATQQQTTKSKVKRKPVSKMDTRLSKSELEGSPSRPDSLEGITPVEEVTEEASLPDEMQEQEVLQEEVSQDETMSEADLIDEFNQIKARIMAGERFNDCSTPIRALLTRISAWHHRDMEAFRTADVRLGGRKDFSDFDEQTKEDITKQLESIRVLEVPIPKPNPSNGDVHPIFTIEREGGPNTPEGELGVYVLFYYDGRWRNLLNTYDQDFWWSEIADEWLRQKLEILQNQ